MRKITFQYSHDKSLNLVQLNFERLAGPQTTPTKLAKGLCVLYELNLQKCFTFDTKTFTLCLVYG